MTTLTSIASQGSQSAEATVAGQAALLLDAQAVAALHQLDPTGANRLVQRVMTTYRSSLNRLLGELTLARARNDVASMRMVTHTLKSSSASVGALALSALCSDAEQAVREGSLALLPALLDQLEVEAVRVDSAVLQLLADPLTNAR